MSVLEPGQIWERSVGEGEGGGGLSSCQLSPIANKGAAAAAYRALHRKTEGSGAAAARAHRGRHRHEEVLGQISLQV